MNNWTPWNNWAEPATYYLDPIAGNDSNAGTSQDAAWATYAKAEQQALTSGQSIQKKVDHQWLPFKTSSRVKQTGVVLGYYQQGSSPIPLSSLDFSALTHISHDHVEPNADGTLNLTYLNMTAANSAALLTAAHAAGVKVLLTIADVGTANFTAAATNHLPLLVQNIIALATSRGYDGVDIDWEKTVSQPALNNFMSVFYAAIKAVNPQLIVSMACAYTNENGALLDQLWAAVAPYADYLNAMCYDMYPPAQLVTWFCAPLYDAFFFGSVGQPVASSWRHIRSLVLAGVPTSKILMGIPFYGSTFAGNVGTPTSGPLSPRQNYPSAASMTDTYTPYNTLPSLYVAADEHWDGVGQCPYLSLVNGTPALNKYVTYDDPASITGKLEWIIARSLAGVAIWELSLDYFSGRSIVSPLLNTVKCGYPKTPLVAGALPGTPAAPTAQNTTTTSIPLNWLPVPSATQYNVKRSTTSGSGYTTLATVSASTCTDATVASGGTYYYVVSALANGTEGANSAELRAVAHAGSTPAAPTGLAASAVSATPVVPVLSVTLTWVGAAPYQSTFVSQTSLSVPAATHGQGVNVIAHVFGTNSAELFPGVGVDTSGNVTISFGAATSGSYSISGFAASGAVNYSFAFTSEATVAIPAATHGFASGALDVAAYDSLGREHDPSVVIDASNNVTVTFGAAVTGRIVISAPASYLVKRSIGVSGGPYVVLALVTGATFTDSTLPQNQNAYYVVSADAAGLESANSAEVAVAASAYVPANLLGSPGAINAAPWSVTGTGASATSATAIACASSGVTSLTQSGVAVTPNISYVATVTLAAASIGGFVTLSVYAPGFMPIPASQGQYVAPGMTAAFRVPFRIASGSSVIFELDCDAEFNGASVTVTNPNVSVKLPGMANLLPSAAAINAAPWTVSGTGASATSGTGLTCASSGATSLAQSAVAVALNTNYTASITLQASATAGYAQLSIYAPAYAATIAHAGASLATTQIVLTMNFNSGSFTSVIFELDLNSTAAGETVLVTMASLAVTPPALLLW